MENPNEAKLPKATHKAWAVLLLSFILPQFFHNPPTSKSVAVRVDSL